MKKENTVGVVPLVFVHDHNGTVIDSVTAETDRVVKISREHIQMLQDSTRQNEAFIAQSIRNINDNEEDSSDENVAG